MTAVTHRVPYASARELIVDAVQEGATLEELEHELIEPLALSRDARDALWLHAWDTLERASRHPPRWRR